MNPTSSLFPERADEVSSRPWTDADRDAVVATLREELRQKRAMADREFTVNSDGLRAARLLNASVDSAIAALYGAVRKYDEADAVAAFAVGGYGRGVLAPYSDIDLAFVHSGGELSSLGVVIDYILYGLWDLGFKVSHAVRSLAECVEIVQRDHTVRTALLDRRLLFGPPQLVARFEADMTTEYAHGASDFIAAKMSERAIRHARHGDSRYQVEPDVKCGKGGLRDLQTLFWLAKYVHGGKEFDKVLGNGVFTRQEANAFRRHARFLWAVRYHIHMLCGHAQDKLTFDIQPELATRMGYRSKTRLTAVERFMKRYFLAARDVGALTRILCARLEKENRDQTGTTDMTGRAGRRAAPALAEDASFHIEDGRLTIASTDIFRHRPLELLRLFQRAGASGLDIHPDAMRQARRRAYMAARLRRNDRARRIFLSILTSADHLGASLRLMHESGVLGAFIPEFGAIVGQTQFDMYHHYTVDEHTLKALETIADIEQGFLADDLPLATSLFSEIMGRRALYLAMLLHDTGKGRGDQQVEGGKRGRKAALRLGLDHAEADLVAWLIGNHLEMNDSAQRRDLSDPAVIAGFVRKVGSVERLRLLFVLTVADIRAVGPGVWNAWKGRLLDDLFHACKAALDAGDVGETAVRARLVPEADRARDTLLARLPGASEALSGIEKSYWRVYGAADQAWHAELLAQAGTETGTKVAARTDADRSCTTVIVSATDQPGLFADLAALVTLSGADLVAARLYRCGDGRVLDILDVRDMQGDALLGDDAARIATEVLSGLSDPAPRPYSPPASRRQAAFIIEPDVTMYHDKSTKRSMVAVSGRDRPGLVSDLGRTLTDHGLTIVSAHVDSRGARVHDVFYVERIGGAALRAEDDPALIAALRTSLKAQEPGAPIGYSGRLRRAPASTGQ